MRRCVDASSSGGRTSGDDGGGRAGMRRAAFSCLVKAATELGQDQDENAIPRPSETAAGRQRGVDRGEARRQATRLDMAGIETADLEGAEA